MLKERARLFEAALAACELVVWWLAFLGAAKLRVLLGGLVAGVVPLRELAPSPLLLAVAWAAWLLSASVTGIRRSFRTRGFAEVASTVLRGALAVFLALAATIFLRKMADESRIFVAAFAVLGGVGCLALHLALRGLLRWLRAHGRNLRHVVVAGDGALAEEVARTMESHAGWGLRFAGFVQVNGHQFDGRVLGTLTELPGILDHNVVDEVVFAVSRHRLAELDEAIAACHETGVSAHVVLDLNPVAGVRPVLSDLDGLPVLGFRRGAQVGPVEAALKRAFDLAVAGVGLALLWPLFVVVAAAIKLDSPGPVFFAQERVGRNGRRFRMYKFRSMVQDAEARKASLARENEADGPVFKMRNDPRVTRVGRLLRRTSIDELPQLWNVLKGEMSVVGPRPPLPEEVAGYERWQRRRLSVRPGLTCFWQVSGRSDVDFATWMRLDMDYVDRRSFWLDLKLVLRTIPAVLLGRGAR